MPCDGIAVASMDIALANELLAAPEAVTAVANLLRNLGYRVSQNASNLTVNNYQLAINSTGQVVGYNVPQKILLAVRDACNAVAGVLTQQKVAEKVAASCQVLEQQYTNNGYLVMKVKL